MAKLANRTSYAHRPDMALGTAAEPSLITRLGQRVQVDGECWVVDGRPDVYPVAHGPYGHINAHRFVFQEVHGVVLDRSIHIHHICGKPGCIRPDHLVAMLAPDHTKLHAGTASIEDVRIDPRRL